MTDPVYFTTLDSPLGPLMLTGSSRALTRIRFPRRENAPPAPADGIASAAPFAAAIEQLEAYFQGRLKKFCLTLEPAGTPFQQATWRQLMHIPYGQTWSYARLATAVGQPSAVRAVGAANGRNPIPIVIPCHRVIGSRGDLTGFGGGLKAKEFLLRLEGSLPRQLPFSSSRHGQV